RPGRGESSVGEAPLGIECRLLSRGELLLRALERSRRAGHILISRYLGVRFGFDRRRECLARIDQRVLIVAFGVRDGSPSVSDRLRGTDQRIGGGELLRG